MTFGVDLVWPFPIAGVWFRRLCVLLLAAAFFACCGPSFAQEQDAQTEAGEVSQAAETPQPDGDVTELESAASQSSPRATLTHFLDAMYAVRAGSEERWPEVLDCIYLDDLDAAQREEQGRQLALELFEVLDTISIDLDSVVAEPESRTADVPLGENGEVSLRFRLNDDGLWRFSRSNLEENIEELQEAAAEIIEEQADPTLNPDLANPRAVLETFLGGMNRWDEGGKDPALSTLDLSEMDENVRGEIGERTAVLLKQVMDHDRRILLWEVPNDPEGAPYVHLRAVQADGQGLAIAIARVPENEEETIFAWKFTAQTVKDAQPLWDIYKDHPLAEGVKDTTPKIFSLQARDWMMDNYPFLVKRNVLFENWQWIGLLAIIMLGMIVSRIIAYFLSLVIEGMFKREALQLEAKLKKGFVIPIRISIMAWVWWLALRPLGLPPEALENLGKAAAGISATALVFALYRLIDIAGKFFGEKALRTNNKFDDLVVPLVTRSLKVFVLAFGGVFIAEAIGIDSTTALTGIGLGGLAFALAAQTTVANLFGSLTVLFDKPFQIGDWVAIEGIEGDVEDVGIRSTRIRTFYNSLITVPNSTLITAIVDNYGARRYRRIKMNILLDNDTQPDKVEAFCEGVRELIRKHPYTRKDYFHVYLNDFTASALSVMLYCFHECPDWSTELRERHRLLLDILRLGRSLGISFAPAQTLSLKADPLDGGSSNILSSDEALTLGREQAQLIVQEQMGEGLTPPPVTFD